MHQLTHHCLIVGAIRCNCVAAVVISTSCVGQYVPNTLQSTAMDRPATTMSDEYIVKIKHMLTTATSKSRVKIIQHVLADLLSVGQIYKKRIHSTKVVIHRTNRDGMGVNVQEVHSLLEDILAVGYHEGLTNPISTDVEESDVEFTKALVMSANGKLGTFPSIVPEAAAVAGSHLTAGLWLINGGVAHDCNDKESMSDTTVHGKLNVDMVRAKDPALGLACDEGLVYTHIPRHVTAIFPELLELIGSAANVKLDRGESETQILRRIFNYCQQQQSASNRVEFGPIKERVAASKPKCVPYLSAMFEFIIKHSGGMSGTLLLDTEKYARAHARASAEAGKEFYELLAKDLPKVAQDQCTMLRHGLLMRKLIHDDISATIVKRSVFTTDGANEAVKAEAVLVKMKEILQGHSDKGKWLDFFGEAQMNIAAWMAGVRHDASIASIAHAACMKAGMSESPWAPSEPTATPAQHEAPECVFRELGPNGQVDASQLMASLGFSVGQTVRRKDKLVATIANIAVNSVHLQVSGQLKQVSVKSFANREWVAFTPPEDPSVVQELSSKSPMLTDEYRQAHMHATLINDIYMLSSKHDDVLSKLSVQLTPKKLLKTTAKFAAGKCIIVPSTLKVTICKEPPMDDALVCRRADDDTQYMIAPWSCNTGIAPWGFLTPVANEEQANMRIVYVGGSSGFKIPVFKNTKLIQAGEVLSFYKKKRDVHVAAEPLVDVPTSSTRKRQKTTVAA